MALVAYDCSDESENENDEESAETEIIIEEVTKSNNKKIDYSKLELFDDEDDETSDTITPTSLSSLPFSKQNEPLNLPTPKNRNVNLSKLSSKTPVPKHVPILSQQSKYSEELLIKKAKSSNQEGGLITLLPPPKNGNVDPEIKIKKVTSLLPSTFLKSKPMGAKKKENDDDDDEESGTDFFSLNKTEKEEEYAAPVEIELPSIKTSSVEPTDSALDLEDSADYTVAKKPEFFNITYEDTSSQDGGLNLDNQAMHLFFGRKRKAENPKDLQIIEIKEEEILAESKQALMKQLTEEVACAPPKKGGCSSLSKRKHQITYLAFQAKERELELKNQWAQNRLTKKQTQAKYGF